ncbi:hypothetical protein [Streptomyces sp. NPDC046862]|uniref:hypothetical protein n=1 Tax=Streptomyces sp. NPDC046862 TaxID=3154603 RepID=UPI003451E59A
MAVDQLPVQAREFASYLNKLLTRIDPAGGWCAVFWQRDPEGMRACLDGREVPPWDVVEALLQDLATAYGPAAAAQEAERARALHGAALPAHDSGPGARDALGDRLGVMIREQRHAAERHAELSHRLRTATTPQEAESLRLDLAWAQDDHERATARCTELRARLTDLDRRAPRTPGQAAPRFRDADAGAVFRVRDRGEHPSEAAAGARRAVSAPPAFEERGPVRSPGEGTGRGGGEETHAAALRAGIGTHVPGAFHTPGPHTPDAFAAPGVHDVPGAHDADEPFGFRQPGRTATDPGPASGAAALTTASTSASVPTTTPAPEPESRPPADPAPKQRTKAKRRPRGSARFAGMMDAEETPPAAVAPSTAPAPAAAPRTRTPRGARFAGAADTAGAARPQPRRRQPLDDAERQEVTGTVETLIALRRDGRSGEAHALLVEAAHWPAARYPLLAAELHRAGLGADWATLLWEAASLPAEKLVAAADALAAAGRATDGEQMLRQGVARPAGEIGGAVLALAREGRDREVRALLDAYVRIRTPEEAARSAEADPQRVGPLLLEAARRVSDERYWDLVHALRVAGFAA